MSSKLPSVNHINESELENYFNSVLYYNKNFVHFLSDFYNLQNKKILDYGCGTGAFTELFSIYGDTVEGCDISKETLDYAQKITNKKINYFQDDFFDSKLHENEYDFIFCKDLGPLQNIDYNNQNSSLVKKIISSLKMDGVAYFTLISKLNDESSEKYKNYNFKTIKQFFDSVGYVSMINYFGNEALVITKTKDLAVQYNHQMFFMINNFFKNLREYDQIGYLKCKLWLYVNTNKDHNKISFNDANQFFNKKIIKSLGKNSILFDDKSTPKNKKVQEFFPIYLVSGERDNYFEQYFTRQIYRNSLTNLKSRLHLK